MKNCESWKDDSCEICLPGFHYSFGNCIAASAGIQSE
jgi:hypothetical protein